MKQPGLSLTIALTLACHPRSEHANSPTPAASVTIGQASGAVESFFGDLQSIVGPRMRHGLICQEICSPSQLDCESTPFVMCTISVWVEDDANFSHVGIDVNSVLTYGVLVDASLTLQGNILAACNAERHNCEILINGPEAVMRAQQACGIEGEGTIVRLTWDEAHGAMTWSVQRGFEVLALVESSGRAEPRCERGASRSRSSG